MFTRHNGNGNKHSRVLTYINLRLTYLYFLFRKDLINHKDINLISFFNCSIICFVINVYSDNQETTLKYLKDTEINLNNILIITVLWCTWIPTFFFAFIYFSWFNISFLLIFLFFFLYISLTMKRHMTGVTWNITWCNIIGLNLVIGG